MNDSIIDKAIALAQRTEDLLNDMNVFGAGFVTHRAAIANAIAEFRDALIAPEPEEERPPMTIIYNSVPDGTNYEKMAASVLKAMQRAGLDALDGQPVPAIVEPVEAECDLSATIDLDPWAIREQALIYAIQTKGYREPPADLVARAEVFYQFLIRLPEVPQ